MKAFAIALPLFFIAACAEPNAPPSPTALAPLASEAVLVAAEQAPLTGHDLEWNAPVEPFNVIGNIYYVGMEGISAFLITTPEGHFVLDGAYAQTAPQIIANIEQLGKLGTVLDVAIGALEADRFDRVDFIKIDVEGAELAVLTHLRPIIERFSPRIVCEVNFSRGYSYDDVQAALGTAEDLLHLDFNASVSPLSREMSKNERVGEDWLVCLN